MEDEKYSILVNKEHPIESPKPDNFEYDEVDITIRNDEVTTDDTIIESGDMHTVVRTFIEKNTNQSFNEMKKHLKSKGIDAKITEAGRTRIKQNKYRENAIKKHGIRYADDYVAEPHESEHHTGLAVDYELEPSINRYIPVGIVKKVIRKLTRPMMYAYAHHICPKYGFVFRFQKNKTHITGFKEERWHARYVGEDLAKELTEEKLSLEEYHAYNEYLEQNKDLENLMDRKTFLQHYNERMKEEYDSMNR